MRSKKLDRNSGTAGIYLHIPFCRSRCSYCDFATDIYRTADAVDRYIHALCKEISNANCGMQQDADPSNPKFKIQNPKSIDTIYFGGGTPSLLDPAQVSRILDTIRVKFSVDPGSEITMEMNPATVTPETLAAYRELGVNRASFGVQTFNDHALRLLARGHNAQDARDTFRMLRDAGFENISFDLIAGLPGQSLKDWEQNLAEALDLGPEHLSLYLLEVHQGTPLAQQIGSGRQPVPDEDLAAAIYEMMVDRVATAGYKQYEISNFARPGNESRHNSKYWRLEPVYGFGVSAHSFDGNHRYSNDRDTAEYVRRIEKFCGAEVAREAIDAESEYIFLGLRMTRGVNLKEFEYRIGGRLVDKYAGELDELSALGLVESSDDSIRLTRKGMLLSNEVFALFI